MGLYEDEITHELTGLAATDMGCFDENLSSICRVPVALHVCHESRRHTLRRYRAIRHIASRNARLYVHPSRDLLWSDAILIDELQNLIDLNHFYRRQLAQIEMLFVEEEEWRVYSESSSTLKHLIPFTGLKMIVILLDDDIEPYYEEANTANDWNSDDDSEQSNGGEVENANEDLELQLRYPGLQGRAAELRAEYTKLLSGQGVPKQICCVDKSGHYY